MQADNTNDNDQTDTDREAPPEHLEDADYVIISAKRKALQYYHRPAPDGDRPACYTLYSTDRFEWTRLDRDSGKLDALDLCGHCTGRKKARNQTGPKFAEMVRNSSPEDFGLDPLPDDADQEAGP